ncbi:MAG: branched-chain amino acid ABC transporter permease [Gammaproteobacteria bacterium]|nr:MAG: branched-chain amino acid ABC transporter permease [Gammaproteobacteria bacterium]
MTEQLLQFLITGITVGSIYALVGLGFAIIYNSSDVINFSQGEFVMIGAISVVSFISLGVPLIFAIILSIIITTAIGFSLYQFAIKPARGATVVASIIITIGVSIFLRGIALLIWGKDFYAMEPFSGAEPLRFYGATILPQNIWIIATTILLVIGVLLFFKKTIYGKAMVACSCDKKAALLMGINVKKMLLLSYGLSASLGALAGVLIVPITFASYDAGIMLGLKGFSSAILGGIGNPLGAVLGGLVLGILESLGAGFISSGYKDAIAFIIILLVLFVRPQGLLGQSHTQRV